MSSGSVDYAPVDAVGSNPPGGKVSRPSQTTTAVLASCAVGDAAERTFSFALDGALATPLSGERLADVYMKVRQQAHAALDAPVTCSHVTPVAPAQGAASDPFEFIHHRMARNCGPKFDVGSVTSYNHFKCKYLGKGLVDGKMVHNPWKEWNGKLASCDGHSEYMEISDSVMEDIRDFVYDAAGGDEAQLDRELFTCSVQTINPYTGY